MRSTNDNMAYLNMRFSQQEIDDMRHEAVWRGIIYGTIIETVFILGLLFGSWYVW